MQKVPFLAALVGFGLVSAISRVSALDATVSLAPVAIVPVAIVPPIRVIEQSPTFDVVQWHNSPALTLGELRGKAVWLQCFRTWTEASTSEVPELGARSAAGEDDGLVLIGVTAEDPERVERWIAAHKPTYPIAVLADSSFERALGLNGHPTTVIVDPSGAVIYAGLEPHSAAKKALSTATRGPYWPRRFAKVVEHVRMRELAKAYSELKKSEAGKPLDEAERDARDRLASHLESAAAAALRRARELSVEGRIHGAAERLSTVVDADPPFPASADARAFLAELRAMPDFKLEMQGGPTYAAGLDLEDAKEYLHALDAYKSVYKRFAETKIASLALARARELIESGKPGFEPGCQDCHRRKKACDAHKKDVKL